MPRSRRTVPPIEDPAAAELPSAPARLDTPGVRTIEDLAADYGLAADRQIKTLVEVLDGKLTLVLLRGDHPLSDQKLVDVTGAVTVRPAQQDEIRAALGALPGSLGAVGATDMPVIADLALRGRRGMSLEFVRAIEVGHIFKLGRKYTTSLGVTVSTADGGTVIPIMGSYGIGVERAMAVIAEVHHDGAGLAWPVQVAPAETTVLLLSVRDPEARSAADVLYSSLLDAGVDALIDDRDVRPGVKYADAELTGIPLRISVGSRDLAEGVVEITKRANGEKERVPVGEAAAWVRAAVTTAIAGSAAAAG